MRNTLKIYVFSIIVLFLACGMSFAGKPQSATLVGQWDFDSSQSLTSATLGNNLTLTGQDAAVAGYDGSDGAARLGVGSYYTCDHGVSPNGGGSYVNEWSLLMNGHW
jgi:hypothetical protein